MNPETAATGSTDLCSACEQQVRGVRPPTSARVAFGAAVATTTVILCAAPLLGFALVFAAPVLACVGMAIGPLGERAFAPPHCPSCGREVEPLARAHRHGGAGAEMATSR